MNILLSAFSCVPGSGSENGNGWNWAYQLARSGHRVFLLTSSAGKAKIEAIVAEEALPNLEIIYIEPPRVSKRFGQFQLIVRYFRWQTLALKVAKELVSQRQIDVVHHATMGSIHVGSPLWKLGKPFLFGPVGGGQVAERGFRRYLRGGWGIEVIRSILVRYFSGLIFNAKSTVSNSSLVLVTNGETQEWARRLGAPEVEFMLDVGISKSMLAMESMRRRPERQCLRILWVGRLLPRKAVLLALEALSRIDQNVCFTCTFIGDGKQGEYLPRWIEQLKLVDRVVWRGQVSWQEVMDAYLDHDVFLFTSLRDSCGSQLLEAMARGAAIVTLDHQGAAKLVPATAGIRVPVTKPTETVDALARALERLAREPEMVMEMGRNAMRVAAEHTWELKVARATECYLRIAGFQSTT